MEKKARIYVTSPNSFVGSAIVEALKRKGYLNLVGLAGTEPDLHDKTAVDAFFAMEKPEYVLFSAGKSAGIMGNIKFPADLILDNLLIECHVIDSAYRHGVTKLLYLASSCCYPKHCPQPMKEEYLLTGSLESTSEAYAVAKIAGLKLCSAYRKQYKANFVCGIPANCFGPGDDFGHSESHVIGALMQKMSEAVEKGRDEVEVWGTGKPRREFIYVDDIAEACIFVLKHYEGDTPINMGVGTDISIGQLAEKIKNVVGFLGGFKFDSSKPDGMPVKVLDTKKLRNLGWKPAWSLEEALKSTYAWMLKQKRGNEH